MSTEQDSLSEEPMAKLMLLGTFHFLLIIGGGHVPILRHCVLASPEHKLVKVHQYLE